MIILDWVLLGIFGYFFIRGITRGMLLELFDLLALVAGYFSARLLGPVGGMYLAGSTGMSRWLAGVLAAVALFVIALLLVKLIAHAIRKAVHSLNLAGFDRMLGAVFGLLKGLLFALSFFLVLSLTPWARAIGNYASGGPISSWMWLASQVVRDAADFEPVSQSQAMSKWLRAAGFNEEIVHIVSDQPGLLPAILNQARTQPEIDLPVDQILRGEPALKLPGQELDLNPETQAKLVEILESTNATSVEKAEAFWSELSANLPAPPEIP